MSLYRVISPVADVYSAPDKNLPRGKFESQLVLGETFNVEAEKDGWCKGTCGHDGYAGYVERHHLAADTPTPTHVVTTARSQTYAAASMKSLALDVLSFGSKIAIEKTEGDYLKIVNGGWIYAKHAAPLPATDKDYVTAAKKFLETPYYWGGRSGFGIDCSGLVQAVLAQAGITAPRDTEQQVQAIGKQVDDAQVGDIVFFSNHVGIMTDEKNIIHANAYHMKVTIEPLDTVVARGKGISAIRRLI